MSNSVSGIRVCDRKYGFHRLMKAGRIGNLAERLSKTVVVNCPTINRNLRNLLLSMRIREHGYWLDGVVDVDDVFFEGR